MDPPADSMADCAPLVALISALLTLKARPTSPLNMMRARFMSRRTIFAALRLSRVTSSPATCTSSLVRTSAVTDNVVVFITGSGAKSSAFPPVPHFNGVTNQNDEVRHRACRMFSAVT